MASAKVNRVAGMIDTTLLTEQEHKTGMVFLNVSLQVGFSIKLLLAYPTNVIVGE